MPDNIGYTPGTGATIAADDISGALYQRVKMTHGIDGSAVDTSATNPLPAALTDRSTTGTISALNGTVSMAVDGLVNAAFHITGTFVARFRFEKTTDGTNWEPFYAYVVGQNDLTPPQMPWDENWSNNIFLVNVAGASSVRVIATGYTSGTISVAIRAEATASHVQMITPPTSPYLTVYDDFEGAALDTLTWEVVTNTITSATVSGSTLTLATGTAIGKYTLLSRQFFGPGMRANVYMSISQRIVNQRFRIELVSIDAAGAVDEENVAGIEFTGTTATAATRRNRAQNGTDDTAALTIVTSATISMFGIELYDGKIILTQTTTAGVTTQIGYAIVKVPDPNRKYKLRIEAENTGVAASTTSVVIGHARFQAVVKVPTEVILSGLNAAAANNALPVVTIYGSGTQPISGSVTATGIAGPAAHDAAISGNPVRIAGRAQTANYTAVATGEVADLVTTLVGALVTKPYAIPELDWSYAAAASGIVNTTTAVTIRAAQAAGIRNYITGIQVSADALGAATELAIRDGAAGTVLWRLKLGTTALQGVNFDFATPLRGSAATLLEVVTLSASVTGGVFVNVQGYSAP